MSNRFDRALLIILAAFTAASIVGYVLFVAPPLGPSNVQWMSRYPLLLRFYGIAFTFFGQATVWVGGAVLILYLIRKTGRQWIAGFVMVYVISLLSETAGTSLGVPFGPYSYTDLLGPKLFGLVPLLIPVSWFLMAVPSYAFARYSFATTSRAETVGRILLGATYLSIWDLSLDPAMSYLTSYWVWGEAGVYYGMPLINLAGWMLTSAVIMIVFDFTGAGRWFDSLSLPWLAFFYALTLLLPISMVIAAGLWLALAVTAVALAVVITISRFTGRSRSHKSVSDTPDGNSVSSSELSQFFESHSRSFSFASRWLSRGERERVSLLYAFCRTTDDIVDRPGGRSTEEVHNRLMEWEERALAAFRGASSGVPWLDRFMRISRDYGVPERLVSELVAGVRMDLEPMKIKDLDELHSYSYHVASVVGIWVCYLFRVQDPWIIDRAVALGRAMQLTNILRDVGEDLEHGRLYLPADQLEQFGITERSLREMAEARNVTEPYREMMKSLIDVANEEYRLAWEAIPHLPDRLSRAVAVAATVYRSIQERIVENGYDNLNRRAYTRLTTKVTLAMRALTRLRRIKKRPPPLAATDDHQKPHVPRIRSADIGAVFIVALSMLPGSISAQSRNPSGLENLVKIHDAYVDGAANKTAIDAGVAMIRVMDSDEPVGKAYEAAFEILRAKYAFWPWRKLAHVERGLPVLDSLVAGNPNDAWIRYLRLASCYFLPGILNRNWSVQEDFDRLGELLPSAAKDVPRALYEEMILFILNRGNIDIETRVNLTMALKGPATVVRPRVPETPTEHDPNPLEPSSRRAF